MSLHWLHHLQHWLALHVGIGTSPVAVYWYSFWSGFGSDIAEYTVCGSVVLGVAHVVRHFNCGVKGCWLPHTHTYEMDGVVHKVCKKHHPALGKGHRLHHVHLLEHFADNQ